MHFLHDHNLTCFGTCVLYYYYLNHLANWHLAPIIMLNGNKKAGTQSFPQKAMLSKYTMSDQKGHTEKGLVFASPLWSSFASHTAEILNRRLISIKSRPFVRNGKL